MDVIQTRFQPHSDAANGAMVEDRRVQYSSRHASVENPAGEEEP
jgi:hypothetical protein